MYSDASSALMQSRRPLWPSDITVHTKSRTLGFVWGSTCAAISHRELRLACRCAKCESVRRGGGMPDASEDVLLIKIEPMGEAGLRLFFSDGHDKGIFPWAYLHQLVFGHD